MFLKNKNIISNIRRSKVTDYAALRASIPRFSADETLSGINVYKIASSGH